MIPSRESAAGPACLPFDEAIAPLQQASTAPGSLQSPRLIQAWAQLLVMYWSRLERLGGLDLSQPLYVLDLSTDDGASGRCAYDVLKAQLLAHGMLGWPVRYLVCPLPASGTPGGAHPPTHPKQAGMTGACAGIDRASWSARTGQPLLLGASRFPLFGSRNPVAALVAGGLAGLAADLYGAHYGSLLRAQVCATRGPGDEAALALDYEWHAWEPGAGTDTAVSVLLEHYRTALLSAPVLVSQPSLALTDALADFTGGRYLLLATDEGVATQQQIQQGAMAPPAQAPDGAVHLPVNFHALGLHQEMAGARVATLQGGEPDIVLQLACRDDTVPMDDSAWKGMLAVVDQGHPADRWRHARAGGNDDLEALDFHLRNSGYDPWALAAALERQAPDSADIARMTESAQAALRRSLALAWHNTPPAMREGALCAALADLLCRLQDWKLARTVLEDPGTRGSASPGLQLLRAQVQLATGHTDSALLLLERLHATQPALAAADALHACLRRRVGRWRASLWHQPDAMRDADLSLELLDEMHVPAWLHQCRDSAIAFITGIAPTRTPQEAIDYLAKVRHEGGAEYALMHSELGLVGAAGMRCVEDMAHVHFWIGTDHQGRGLGTRAMALLARCLAATPVQHLFTSVYRHNLRSRRILARAGFQVIAHAAQGNDQCYEFMHLDLAPGQGQAASDDEIHRRLVRICAAIGEPLLGQAPSIHHP